MKKKHKPIRFPKSIGMDVDGVILEFDWDRWWKEGKEYLGEPIKDAIWGLNELMGMGYKIILHTCRVSPAVINGYKAYQLARDLAKKLREMGVPFDDIWIGEGKPAVDFYLDNKCLRFEGNWKDTIKQVKELPFKIFEVD